MSNAKAEILEASQQGAKNNFTTDNKISGGCEECGCEVLIYYHYDSDKPVPDAPFTLIDSKGSTIEGRTDARGLCLVENMGCGPYELLIEEGSDTFAPQETVANNPVLQDNPEYARLAGEYFTLFLLLRGQELVEYDPGDSSDRFVDVDNAGWFRSVPHQYRQAWARFWQLDRRINRGSRELKRAVNQIHHALAAEVAGQAGDDNTALLLFCEIALGFIPVVGQAMDVYAIGRWSWDTCEQPDLLQDNMHVAAGVLCVIGFIPGLGDAIKVTGRAILNTLGKAAHAAPKEIQFAIRVLRSLSDGNLRKGLLKLRSQLEKYAADGRALLMKIHAALEKVLADASKPGGSWIITMMKDSFTAITGALKKLIAKYDDIVAWLGTKIDEFISKIVTRLTGEKAAPRGSYLKKNADGSSAAQSGHNAGANREHTAEKPGSDKATGRNRQTEGQSCNKQCESDPVDMATGAVVEWRKDFTLPGPLPLVFKRYYRSRGERHAGLLGSLWRSSWDISLTLERDIVTLNDGEYNLAYFPLPQEGERVRASSSPQWRLTREQGRLCLLHADGTRHRFEHALGRQLCLTATEDRAGNRIRFLWERGTLRWLVLADGRLVHVETAHGRITALTLCDAARKPLRTLASYRYDKRGYLLSVRAGEGRSFDYTWSAEGWMLRWSDLSHTWVEHDYDSLGRATEGRSAEGLWPGRFVWDDAALTGYFHNGFGGVTRYVRDGRNNIIGIRRDDGGETHFEWVDNQLMAQTDALGNRTVFSRDEWGQITGVTLADGATHRYHRDEQGQLLGYTDPAGSRWCCERDGAGRLTRATDPEGRAWQYQWDERGQLHTAVSPDGSVQRWSYDARGLLRETQGTGEPAVSFYHDAQGRLTERHTAHESGTLIRRWEYHGEREAPDRVIYEDGSETGFGYDTEGNLTTVTDALGQRRRLRYGAFDNLAESTDPQGATVRYHYNTESVFAGVTNSRGQRWRYRFDRCGRLSEEQHYDGRIYHYRYDRAGQLMSRRAPDGSELQYSHDSTGRVSEIRAVRADGTEEGTTVLCHDPCGRLVRAVSPDAVVEYAWSPAGQLLSERMNGKAVSHGYNAAGELTTVSGPLSTLGLAWQNGRLVTLSAGGHQPLSFSHNAQGEEVQRSNGQGFVLQQAWSRTGLLTRQSLAAGGGQVNDVLERRYRYDVLDRLTGIQDSHWGVQQFRLNGAGQVTAERRTAGREQQTRLFGYDSEQNLHDVSVLMPDGAVASSVQSGYDVAGRVIRRGDGEYTYDACGRLVMKRRMPAGFRPQETRYEWDVHDRLMRITLPDGVRWRYRYDFSGRRVSKAREGQLPSRDTVARVEYRWEGDRLSGQQPWLADGSAAREVQWVYEPGSFRPLAQVSGECGETQLHYIVTDVSGAARELCSEEGRVVWRGEQGLWGGYRERTTAVALRRWPGDAANDEVSCALRYQGQLYDAESGLYYNRHRYYDPELGQYISPDPIGLLGGERPYGYVHNPLMWVDPLGLAGCNAPNGYKTGDVDQHGKLSPGDNRAAGHTNSRADGFVQSHHPIQDAWAKKNIDGYNRNSAPATLLKSSSGSPHAAISAAQRTRRAEQGGWNTTLKKEFNISAKEMRSAGVPTKQVNKSIRSAYKYYDGLRGQNKNNPFFDI